MTFANRTRYLVLRFRVVVFLILLLPCITGCSRFFYVLPEGNIETFVKFRFFSDRELSKPNTNQISMVVVREVKSDGAVELVWVLEGRESLSEVIYGKVYEQLQTVQNAIELKKDKVYEVFVHDLSPGEPPGSAYRKFAFDDSGKLKVL